MENKKLPSYLANAKPNPSSNRAPWYKNTTPTYAGIFLWFVFWDNILRVPNQGGILSQGILIPIGGIILAAFLCHFLFYYAGAMFGMKKGMPLYIIGSSIFGATGGILMPGLLMGILQYGWLAVNIYFSALLLHETLSFIPIEIIMIAWGGLAAFMGLKGIKYVAKVSSFGPFIPLSILLVLVVMVAKDIPSFQPSDIVYSAPVADSPLSSFGVVAFIIAYVIGFFATAGAAGVDFGSNARNKKDVSLGGLYGIVFAIALTCIAALLIVAGAYANPELSKELTEKGTPLLITGDNSIMNVILGSSTAKILMFLLAISAFPSACFSSLIAANSFKAMLPKVNSSASVACGAVVAIALAITGVAGNAMGVFTIIGASFGPICGALLVEYIISKGKWNGPRRGFNLAGWLSWAAGFTVGILPLLKVCNIPIAPLMAFLVGAIVYFICNALNLKSKNI